MVTIPRAPRGKRAGGGDVREEGEREVEAETLSGWPRLYIFLFSSFPQAQNLFRICFVWPFCVVLAFLKMGRRKETPTPTAGHCMALWRIVGFGYTGRRKTGSCHGPSGGPRVAG